MFRKLPEVPGAEQPPFAWTFDGAACAGYPHESVAAALLREGVPFVRHHPVDASARLPFCMMGQCQECLVSVEGGPLQRACMLPLRPGMDVCSGGSPQAGA